MPDNQTGKSEGDLGETSRGTHPGMIPYWVIGLLLVLLVSFYPLLPLPISEDPVIVTVSMVVIYALIAMTFERGLAGTPVSRSWRYRLSFLLSTGLAVAQIVTLWIFSTSSWVLANGIFEIMFSSQLITLVILLSLVFGAFVGAFVATILQEGLVEVNPPPAVLTMKIFQTHLAVIGVPGAGLRGKRIFDLLLAMLGFVFSVPIWLASISLIWIEDPGPVLFVKHSIGRGGKNFRLLKFRTMALEMEKHMALVQTQEVEAKTLRFGRFLRKTALDELPQLLNILRGEMSFVGPRPHRTPLVALYLEKMPEFAERHMVLPGLAGLAQVSGDFYMTPRQKLRFDRLYIKHRSVGFDIKLMFLAFLITFWYRWQKKWNRRLPRRLLH